MTAPVFNPPETPSYTSAKTLVNQVDARQLQSGWQQVRPIGIRPREGIQATWIDASEATREYCESFLMGLEGGIGPLTWTSFNTVPSPTGTAPTLEEVAGGALGARTYYVAFSWYETTGTQETLISAEASLAVQANFFIKVTIPPFPLGVDEARLYLSETSGALKLETTITARTWTQSVALAGVTAPPSTNTLLPARNYMLAPAGLQVTPTAFELYTINLTLEETFLT